MQFSPAHNFSYYEPTFPNQERIDIPEITYMDFQQILDSDHDTEWLVKDFLEKGGHTLITGKTGTGKSMLTLNIALSLASDDCFDVYGYHKPKSLKIAIIQCENPLSSIKKRIKDLCKINPAFKKGLTNIRLVQFDGKHDNSEILMSDANFGQILKQINDDFKPDLLIVDPYLCYSGVSENDNRKNREVLRKLHSRLDALDITSIIVHHEGKGFQSSTDKSRGASSIADAMFYHWTIQRKTDATTKKEELVLFRAKARDSERNRQISLSIREGIYFLVPDNPYDPVKLVEILKANNGSFESQKDLIHAIRGQRDVKISAKKAKEMIDTAIEKGFILKEEYGQNKFRFSLPSS